MFYTDSLQQHGGIQRIQQSGWEGKDVTWAGFELFQRMTLTNSDPLASLSWVRNLQVSPALCGAGE